MPATSETPEKNPSVPVAWKYAAITGGVLLLAQAWWWNKKAPEVLKLGSGSGGYG